VYGAAADRQQASIAYELHTKAVDILEGRRVDPTFYPVVYGLKDDEDWEDEANWYKVNPSLGTGDITAFVLMFPPRDVDEKYVVLPFFWVPEETIPQRVKAASVPYDVWEKQGHLLATEGNVIHYDFIEHFIEELGEKYHILEIAFDRWGATQMVQDLEGMGFTVVPFGQGYSSMSAPTKEFYKILMEGRMVHGGNPVLRWMAGNVVIDTDPAGNIKVTKARSKEKIDGIVAAIMALDRCIRNQGQQQGSVYDQRGLLVF
jgi:phage terminase large subunit-like protein